MKNDYKSPKNENLAAIAAAFGCIAFLVALYVLLIIIAPAGVQ